MRCFYCKERLDDTGFTYNHLKVYNCGHCDIDYVNNGDKLYELEDIEIPL